MTEDKRIHWKSAIRISGAFVATIIGSGFASGQELVQFFTVYNIAGAVGAAIWHLQGGRRPRARQR